MIQSMGTSLQGLEGKRLSCGPFFFFPPFLFPLPLIHASELAEGNREDSRGPPPFFSLPSPSPSSLTFIRDKKLLVPKISGRRVEKVGAGGAVHLLPLFFLSSLGGGGNCRDKSKNMVRLLSSFPLLLLLYPPLVNAVHFL